MLSYLRIRQLDGVRRVKEMPVIHGNNATIFIAELEKQDTFKCFHTIYIATIYRRFTNLKSCKLVVQLQFQI